MEQFAKENDLGMNGGAWGMFACFNCASGQKAAEVARQLINKLPNGCEIRSGRYPYQQLA